MADKNLILMICTANICRSPMAEGLLRHALQAEPEPLRSLQVASAGVAAYSGEPASAHSVRVLKKVGLDISQHRSQSIQPRLLERAFAVFGMTQSHLLALQAMAPTPPPHLCLMREFMGNGATLEIPDPFGMDIRAYETCRDSMVEAIPPLLDWLRENYRP